MGLFQFLILFRFIAYIEAIKPKSVNLALETVLEFSNKDNAEDLKFLDNVQQFLDKVNTVIRPERLSRRRASADRNLTFTEFIKSVVNILKSYDDEDLEDVFAVFDDEIRKYHYRGCKFYELVEDQNVRRFVANKLDRVKEKPAAKLRNILDAALRAIENDAQAEFLEYVNSLYRQGSNDILKTFLKNLHAYSKYKRANLNLIKIVRDGIRSVIFDHYSALNANARRDFKIKLETSWRNFKHPERIEHEVWTVQYTNMNKVHPSRTYGHADDITRGTTPAVPRVADAESDVSAQSQKRKLRAKKHRVVQYKVDIKKVDNDESTETTARSVKMKSPNTERSVTSELLNTEEITQTPYKHKKINKKYRVIKEKLAEYKKSKHKSHKTHKYKKLSSFITLYPEEITFNTRKRSIKPTTRKPKLYTLWEENIKSKKQQNDKKHRRPKYKANFRINNDKPNVISETDTVINVNRAVLSTEDDAVSKPNRPYETHRQKMTTKEHHIRRTIENTETEHKPTRQPRKISRKHDKTSQVTSLSEEGMSIESYEHNRRLMTEMDTNTSVHGLNVLRRINNLERQMEEMKNKIDTKIPTVDTTTENIPFIQTAFEPLEFWEGPTTATMASPESTTIATETSISLSTLYTKPSANNKTEYETTKSGADNRNNTNDTNNVDLTFRTGNDTKVREGIVLNGVSAPIINDTVFNEKNNFANALEEDDNEIGLDFDNGLDKIMKKYNISDIDIPKASSKPFDFDEFLKESEKLANDEKLKKESLFERDMKKILNETINNNRVNNFNNPMQTLSAAFDRKDEKAKITNDLTKNNLKPIFNVTSETNAMNTRVNSFNNSILDSAALLPD